MWLLTTLWEISGFLTLVFPQSIVSSPSYKGVFSLTLILATTIVIFSPHWLAVWIFIEINLLSFIALSQHSIIINTAEAATKYFVTQSAGSAMFLVGGLSSYIRIETSNIREALVTISILIKLGAAPFHFWVPHVVSNLPWEFVFVLSTWQKLAPLWILTTTLSWEIITILCVTACLRAMIGGLAGIGQSQIRPIIAFSSIRHLGWILRTSLFSKVAPVWYLLAYRLILAPIILTMLQINLKSPSHRNLPSHPLTLTFLALALLSLGGIPPLSGFILKWAALQYIIWIIPFVLILIILIGRLCNLFFYLKVLYPSVLLITSPTHHNSSPVNSLIISISGTLLALSCLSATLLL